MPEGPELENELDRVKESIEEARHEEREDRGFLRRVSLSTALIAVIAAVAALQAGATINEALLKKNEAMATHNEAFDLWAQYQAKGIKSSILKQEKQTLISLDRVPQASLDQDIARYQKEQDEISSDARKKEEAARQNEVEAGHLTHRHHRYASSVALMQIAVALSAIAALSKNRLLWTLSILVAVSGTILFADGFLLFL
jgi:uncharacterized membrane protein YjjP (DUF1212 family)